MMPMKRNSRLSLALHTLGHMASAPSAVQTSAAIAQHAGTNPVVVRRVLGRLRDAGLLASEKGHAGGWRLARPPHEISLADVYLALEERMIAPEPSEPTSHCDVEQGLHRRVASILEEAEQSLIARLGETSILEVRG